MGLKRKGNKKKGKLKAKALLLHHSALRLLRDEFFSLVLACTLIIISLVFSGCTNSGSTSSGSSKSSSSKSTTTGGTTTPSSSGSFTIFKVTVTAPPSSGDDEEEESEELPLVSMYFQVNSALSLTEVCQAASTSGSGAADGSRSCYCQFQWNETNLSDSSVIPRTVFTEPSKVTPFLLECPVPNVYEGEIADGTQIKVKLVPNTDGGNSTGFTTSTFTFTKESIFDNGDFRDIEGRSYKNLYHYSCYDRWSKASTLTHKKKVPAEVTSGTQPPAVPLANDFELGGSSGTNYSAQSYYFDFYVRSNEAGTVNSGNSSFTCPQVMIDGVPRFYPMDSTIAVAVNASKDFSVRVVAGTLIGSGSSSSSGTLGYAAKVNADGTCPSFTDSAGKIRRTFRLRRYTSIYPLRFGATGDIAEQQQVPNIVYVLDRPVDKLTQDPLKPITRLGPKPCPFSFKTAQFGYKCSTDSSISGWNIDGTQIQGDPGCPVYPPPPSKYLRSDGTLVIRPFKPFLAHYLEDTNYKACTFESSTPVDPELVLVHDDNAYPLPEGPFDSYCARHYPAAGAIIPPIGGDPFDKPPGDCDDSTTAAAIKADQTYACNKTFDPTGNVQKTPSAGCCQICSGTDCRSSGGGITPAGRNAAFTSPGDTGNPATSFRRLPRAVPNLNGGNGCFNPNEDTGTL
jgi:hypothetical protein